MPKPLGGRGCKAPYQTMTMRIPVDVKSQVEEIVERFREGDLEIVENDNSENNKILRIQEIIERYRTKAKDSRDWTHANKLIEELTSEIDNHE
jgi:TRAP-type mannitol/chloroaromatic compound transport system substrate-binding protein